MWFYARANDYKAKMFVQEDDVGIQVSRIEISKGNDSPKKLDSIHELDFYGFDVPCLWLDLEEWYEKEMESREDFI